MGYVTGAFGIKGWVKVQPLTETPENLLDYPSWWIGGDDGWTRYPVEDAETHVAAVAAKLGGCGDRDEAARLRGLQVAVPRSEFPEAGEDEFYWADLIGLRVVNVQGEALGSVFRVFETGANDVLVVNGPDGKERLIPFIEAVVQEVDLPGRTMRVDWGLDF